MGDPAQSILCDYNSVCLSICQGLWQPELTHTGTNYSYRFLNEHIMKSTCFIFFSSADHFHQADFSLLYQLSVPGAHRAVDQLMGAKSHNRESWEHKALTLFHRYLPSPCKPSGWLLLLLDQSHKKGNHGVATCITLGLMKHPRKRRQSWR